MPGPWDDPSISLTSETIRHLRTVLRMSDGDPCSYTDGAGRVGIGVLRGNSVERGKEHSEPHPPSVVLAVAPPSSKDRVRWMVEKVCELGVARIRWLRTVRCEGRVPRHDKALAWAQMAMEQSRRPYLTQIDSDWTRISDLSGLLVALDREGDRLSTVSAPVTLLVGPEGGWDPSELSPAITRVTLGDSVLRTETAAIVGAHAIVSALS